MKTAFMALALGLPLLLLGCTVGADYTPAPPPPPGDLSTYNADWQYQEEPYSHANHIAGLMTYYFLDTNSDQPPYEAWGDTLGRDFTTGVATLSDVLFQYDWDDPYVDN